MQGAEGGGCEACAWGRGCADAAAGQGRRGARPDSVHCAVARGKPPGPCGTVKTGASPQPQWHCCAAHCSASESPCGARHARHARCLTAHSPADCDAPGSSGSAAERAIPQQRCERREACHRPCPPPQPYALRHCGHRLGARCRHGRSSSQKAPSDPIPESRSPAHNGRHVVHGGEPAVRCMSGGHHPQPPNHHLLFVGVFILNCGTHPPPQPLPLQCGMCWELSAPPSPSQPSPPDIHHTAVGNGGSEYLLTVFTCVLGMMQCKRSQARCAFFV